MDGDSKKSMKHILSEIRSIRLWSSCCILKKNIDMASAQTLVCVKQVKQEKPEEWDESMPWITIADEFFVPTKAKSELTSQLAKFSHVEVIWVKVRRGESTLKLQTCVVAERDFDASEKVAILGDLTSDQCSELQELSRSLVNVEYRGYNKRGVKYDWKMKVGSYLPDQRCTIVSSILFMPLPGEKCTEATTARCMAWFLQQLLQGFLLFLLIFKQNRSCRRKGYEFGVGNKITQQQQQQQQSKIVQGIRLWFMPGAAEMLVDLIPQPGEVRFGLDIKRTDEGLICIHSVTKGSAADRCGLGSLHEEAYASGPPACDV
ncbi:hypothetical protein GBA52_028392 [Prunus armeniaca]|nr:hypothetical protein GBA52_028392 [Prunus armeniaca]